MVEICVAVISACLPTYRPLFRYARYGTVKKPTIDRKSTAGYHNLKYPNMPKTHPNIGGQVNDKTALEKAGDDTDGFVLDRLSRGSHIEFDAFIAN